MRGVGCAAGAGSGDQEFWLTVMSLRITSVLELPIALRDQAYAACQALLPTPRTATADELRHAQFEEQRNRLVDAMLAQLRYAGLDTLFEREFAFHPTRKWRLDLFTRAPTTPLGIELHGAVSEFNRGRHLRGGPQGGFVRDREKINAAIECGIRVLEYWPEVIADGSALAQIERIVS
jgi:hypothetical protein